MLFTKPSVWLALAGLVLGAFLVIRMNAQSPLPPRPQSLPAKPFARSIGASGLVESRQKNTAIGVPVPGLVTQVLVDVWDKVEIGTPLFLLDDRDLRGQLLDNQAQIQLKSAQLERAKDQFTRLQAIDDPRAISAQDLKDRRLDVAVAEADLASVQSAVVHTQQLIERLTVRSPIVGTILQVNIRAGEYASPTGGTSPLLIGNIENVWLRADIDEQVAPRVRPGKPAVGYLKGDSTNPIAMEFVRIEPYVIPKQSLTGASSERVDTRVLQVVYQFRRTAERRVYVGQQMDLFIEDSP